MLGPLCERLLPQSCSSLPRGQGARVASITCPPGSPAARQAISSPPGNLLSSLAEGVSVVLMGLGSMRGRSGLHWLCGSWPCLLHTQAGAN